MRARRLTLTLAAVLLCAPLRAQQPNALAALTPPPGREGEIDDGVEYPSKKPAPPGSLEEFRQKVWAVIAEIEPLMLRLDALRVGYAEKRDLRPLFKEREELRVRVRTLLSQLGEMENEYDRRRSEEEIEVGASAMRSFFSEGGIPKDAKESLARAMNLARFSSKVGAVVHRAQETLKIEEDAYNAAQRSIRNQQIWAAICGGILLVAVVAVLFAWRKGRRAALPPGRPAAALPPPPTPAAVMVAHPAAVPIAASLAGPRTTPMPLSLPPGTLLGGNYRIVKELGKGSLGMAYEALDASGGGKVVVKRLRDELHGSEKDLDRLIEQLRFVASLRHPGLAEVLSVFIEAGRVHLAIEHVDGLPLSKFLDPGNRTSLGSVVRVLGPVGAVLDYAHEAKVLHGDLKPSNILVLRDGRVKVSDFGVGLEIRKLAARLSWGEPIGSPAYMAPECELGTILKESDSYSLGVVLYEMLTGRLPFEGPNFLAQKREMRYQPPSRLVPGLPPGVDAVVQRALQPEPQRRFHKAAELGMALESAGSGG